MSFLFGKIIQAVVVRSNSAQQISEKRMAEEKIHLSCLYLVTKIQGVKIVQVFFIVIGQTWNFLMLWH